MIHIIHVTFLSSWANFFRVQSWVHASNAFFVFFLSTFAPQAARSLPLEKLLLHHLEGPATGDAMAQELTAILDNKSLKELVLLGCGIGDVGAQAGGFAPLIFFLTSSRRLHILHIAGFRRGFAVQQDPHQAPPFWWISGPLLHFWSPLRFSFASRRSLRATSLSMEIPLVMPVARPKGFRRKASLGTKGRCSKGAAVWQALEQIEEQLEENRKAAAEAVGCGLGERFFILFHVSENSRFGFWTFWGFLKGCRCSWFASLFEKQSNDNWSSHDSCSRILNSVAGEVGDSSGLGRISSGRKLSRLR